MPPRRWAGVFYIWACQKGVGGGVGVGRVRALWFVGVELGSYVLILLRVSVAAGGASSASSVCTVTLHNGRLTGIGENCFSVVGCVFDVAPEVSTEAPRRRGGAR